MRWRVEKGDVLGWNPSSAALKLTNKNPLLPPSDTITRKALFQLDSVAYDSSSTIKSQKPPTFKLPRVSTPKNVALPSRVSPSTTQHFHNIFPTTPKHRRYLWAVKYKTYPKISNFIFTSPKLKSNTLCSISYIDNTADAFTSMHINDKLQHLVQQ